MSDGLEGLDCDTVYLFHMVSGSVASHADQSVRGSYHETGIPLVHDMHEETATVAGDNHPAGDERAHLGSR